MICPYNNFKPCVKGECPAWRYVKDPLSNGYDKTCVIAVNGGVPNSISATSRESEELK